MIHGCSECVNLCIFHATMLALLPFQTCLVSLSNLICVNFIFIESLSAIICYVIWNFRILLQRTMWCEFSYFFIIWVLLYNYIFLGCGYCSVKSPWRKFLHQSRNQNKLSLYWHCIRTLIKLKQSDLTFYYWLEVMCLIKFQDDVFGYVFLFLILILNLWHF